MRRKDYEPVQGDEPARRSWSSRETLPARIHDPRENGLGADMKISRTMVPGALMLLEEIGLIRARRGVRPFVWVPSPSWPRPLTPKPGHHQSGAGRIFRCAPKRDWYLPGEDALLVPKHVRISRLGSD